MKFLIDILNFLSIAKFVCGVDMYGGEMKSCQISKYLTLRHHKVRPANLLQKIHLKKIKTAIKNIYNTTGCFFSHWASPKKVKVWKTEVR